MCANNHRYEKIENKRRKEEKVKHSLRTQYGMATII